MTDDLHTTTHFVEEEVDNDLSSMALIRAKSSLEVEIQNNPQVHAITCGFSCLLLFSKRACGLRFNALSFRDRTKSRR